MMQKDSKISRAGGLRSLLRQTVTAALGTTMAEDRQPYTSLVQMATDSLANPLLLLSDLAVHSRNISQFPEISLMVAEPPADVDPLTQSRITLQGKLVPGDAVGLKARYLRRYPSAENFIQFTDFNLYSLQVSHLHLVAGFGDIHWLEPEEVLLDPHFLSDGELEADIIDHMNEDHSDALEALGATVFSHHGEGACQMVAVDPEGIDVRLGWQYGRILFERPVSSPQEVRQELIHLVRNARI